MAIRVRYLLATFALTYFPIKWKPFKHFFFYCLFPEREWPATPNASATRAGIQTIILLYTVYSMDSSEERVCPHHHTHTHTSRAALDWSALPWLRSLMILSIFLFGLDFTDVVLYASPICTILFFIRRSRLFLKILYFFIADKDSEDSRLVSETRCAFFVVQKHSSIFDKTTHSLSRETTEEKKWK